jgi:hypothetical protein
MAMTPQEKKRLSYERDRRNTYGENDKSSRKNIPRGKRLAVRAARRFVSVALVDVRGNVDAVGVGEMSGVVGVVDGGPADKLEPRIAGRRLARFRKWRDEPLGVVVAYQLGRRVEADPAAAAVADARIRRVEHRLGHRLRPDEADVAPWIRSLAMIDRQIRLRDGDRMRRWVKQRFAEVRRAERAGAFTPYDVALQVARFVAGLHRDGIAAAVAELLPQVDELVRECLKEIPLSEREVRAARPVDAQRIRDAFRLVDAVGPLGAYVVDPVLATELRAWRRLRHLR